MSTPDGELKIVEKLLALHELEGIGDVALLNLAHNTRIEKFPPATVLRASEHQDRRLYLLEGVIELVADNKTIQSIDASSARAATPLFRIHTPGLTAICHGVVTFLSIDDSVFEYYAGAVETAGSGIVVAEYQQNPDEPEVVTEVRLDFTHSEVDLPSMPEIANRIYSILQNDDVDLRQVAETIKIDPIISVRIIQVANSALYRSAVPIETIKDAISRIGLNSTRAIVMSVVLKSLFTAKSKLIHRLFNRFYQHSIRVAAVAHTLAKQLKSFDPDEALLAGLIHDIGVVPILVEADHHKGLNENEAELEDILQQHSSKVGSALLSQWGFEEVFVLVAQESENWSRQAEHADYCDLIQVAQLHCNMVGGKKIMAPPISEIHAFKRLELEHLDLESIIKEAKHEIHEIVDLLCSS